MSQIQKGNRTKDQSKLIAELRAKIAELEAKLDKTKPQIFKKKAE